MGCTGRNEDDWWARCHWMCGECAGVISLSSSKDWLQTCALLCGFAAFCLNMGKKTPTLLGNSESRGLSSSWTWFSWLPQANFCYLCLYAIWGAGDCWDWFAAAADKLVIRLMFHSLTGCLFVYFSKKNLHKQSINLLQVWVWVCFCFVFFRREVWINCVTYALPRGQIKGRGKKSHERSGNLST